MTLRSQTRTVVIADSNMKHVQEQHIPHDWQLAVIPGAKFSHIITSLDSLPTDRNLTIVMAAGINHRDWDFESKTASEVDKLQRHIATHGKNLFAVGVAFNKDLPVEETTNLTLINEQLHQHFAENYIPALSPREVKTGADGIHYTEDTCNKIWASITEHLTKN